MVLPRFVVRMISLGMIFLGTAAASGQDYPNKPIRWVTSAPGGGGDFLSRLIAQGISGSLGQPVIVDNRAGAVISGTIVSKALPDGYTLLMQSGALWIAPLLQNTPYDPVRDFSPITLAVNSPNILVVHPSLPVKSVKELIALAKARPGELNYGTGGTGSSPHLAAELFKAMAGVNIVRIAYKGGGPALNALIGGEVQMTIDGTQLVPHIKSGRLRALAVTSLQPTALVPNLPAVAESLPGYESVLILSIWTPAKTPVAIINRLNQEIVRFLKTAEVKEQLFKAGVEVVGSSPEELAATVKSEMAKMGKLIKDAGIKVN